ncbi:hypothetical protein IR145_04745, partial [Streptococcus danieliae]|nr:hypothetical protein [Streptococcus danieliae]
KQNIVDVIKAIYEKMLTIPNYQTYIKEKLFSNISTKNYSNILKDMKDLSINNYKEIAIKISDELNKIANFREKKRVDFNLSESRRDFLEKVDSEIIFDDTL